jgi:HK97 family phage major capsid protein
MWSRLLGASRPNAVWLINQNIEPQLYTMSLSVGTGGAPVFMPAGGASASPYMTLFGRPIIVCEQCATLGTVGDIILADLTDGYILAEKGGIKSDMSIHVRFEYDESIFRFVMRIDGQPVLSSAITPYKGGSGNSQSHFIALQSRT